MESSETLPATAFQPSLLIVDEVPGALGPVALRLHHGLDLVTWKVTEGPDLQVACFRGAHLAEQVLAFLPNAIRRCPIQLGNTAVSLASLNYRLRYRPGVTKRWRSHLFTLGRLMTLKIALPHSERAGRDPRRPVVLVQVSVPRLRLYLGGNEAWDAKNLNTVVGIDLGQAALLTDQEILPAVHAWLLQLLPGILERMGVTRRRIIEGGVPKFGLVLAQKPEVYLDAEVVHGPTGFLENVHHSVQAVQRVIMQGVAPQVTAFHEGLASVADLVGGHRLKAYFKDRGRVLRLEVTGRLSSRTIMGEGSLDEDYGPALEYAVRVGEGLMGVWGDALAEPLTEPQRRALCRSLLWMATYDHVVFGIRLIGQEVDSRYFRELRKADLLLPNPAPRTGYHLSRRASAYIQNVRVQQQALRLVNASNSPPPLEGPIPTL